MLWAGAAVAGTLVWLASPELPWPARLLTAFMLGPAPVAALAQAALAAELPRPLPRVRLYVGSIVALCLLGLIALAAGISAGFTFHLMGFTPPATTSFALWTAFALLGAGATVTAFKAFGFRDADLMRDIAPVTRSEKFAFVLLSAAAGIGEEVAFRGFLIPALTVATGSLAAGVAISSLSFGILHAHQRAGGAARASVLGVMLAIPLIAGGSLYPSIAAHVLIDLIGGLWLARWLFK